MTTEAFLRDKVQTGSYAVMPREAAQWVLARVSDGNDGNFTLEVDERFWRLRRVCGATSSMFESRLGAPMSAGDLAAALVRWATAVGFTARHAHEDGALRVSIVRPAD